MFILKRVLLGLAATLLVLGLAAVVLFYFGGPSAPASAPVPEAGPATTAAPNPMTGAQDDGRFIVEVPGCTCHSDDPVLVAEHATYRMSECAGCH